MKKTIAILLTWILAGSLAACGGTPSQGEGISGSGEASGPVPEISFDGEVTGEITVQSYDTMMYKSLLEEAAKLFEEKYPGAKVNVETFSAMPEVKTMETEDGNYAVAMYQEDDSQSRQDYLIKVNTQLMSGGGADVLAMDVLPVHRLARNGRLEDLTGYMDADAGFDRSDYRANILDAVRYQGGTYFLPYNYSFDYYAYDSTLYTPEQAAAIGAKGSFTFRELVDLTEGAFREANAGAGEITRMFSAYGEEEIIDRMLEEAYGEFVDEEGKTARFTDGGFEALLESVKAYAADGYFASADMVDDGENIVFNFEQDLDERFFFKPRGEYSLMQHFNKDSGVMLSVSGYGYGNEEDDEIAGIQADSSGGVPFTYTQAFGINANSANKRTAWEFVKFLLGEEMQLSTNSMLGLPVHNGAREKKAALMMSGEFYGLEGAEVTAQQQESLENYMAAVESLSDRINTYNAADASIMEMIRSELEYYIDGSKTAEQVAATLQSKVDLYLNE